MKKLALPILLAAALYSCDVRTKDVQSGTEIAGSMGAEARNTVNQADKSAVKIIDSSYNFGVVSEGQIVEYSFRFQNAGNKPLIIQNAQASCGCTVPEKPEQPIMPGEMGYIKIKFDSKGQVGNVHKSVTVTSNAEPEFPQLMLLGEVKAK